MKLNWIKNGVEIKPGLEEGTMELIYFPGIPMSVIFGSVQPGTPEDKDERSWLIHEAQSAVNELEHDRDSRRALFYNLYPGGLKINCLSLFHFTIRDDKLELYVYCRSTLLNNMGYDLVTIDRVYQGVYAQLRVTQKVEPGNITVHFHCLHYYTDK